MFKARFENNLSVCHRGTLRGVCFHHQVQLQQNPSIPHNSLKKGIMATLMYTGCFNQASYQKTSLPWVTLTSVWLLLNNAIQCNPMQCNPMRFKTLSSGCSCCKSISTNNRGEPGYWHPYLGQWKTRPWNFKSSKSCDNWQMCENAFGSFVKAVIREFQWVRICQSVEYNQL